MHKRCIAGILLAALLVSLCGCTSVFDKEYLSVRPYEEPSNLLTDADTTQIRQRFGWVPAFTIDDAVRDLWRAPDLASALVEKYQ